MCQADRVPQNEDSATQKQLVLVRTEGNTRLSDVLFPAASDLDSSGFPDPGDVARAVASARFPHAQLRAAPSLRADTVSSPPQTLHSCFFSGESSVSLSRMSLFHLKRRSWFHSL